METIQDLSQRPPPPQGTGQFVGSGAKPTPGAPDLQGALGQLKSLFQSNQAKLGALTPYVKQLELLERSIAQTQALITAKLEARADYDNDQDELEQLRDMFRNALDQYNNVLNTVEVSKD